MPLEITYSTEATALLPDGGEAIRTTYENLDFDIISSDIYNVEAEISDHAVEQGVDITDHTEPKKDRITVEAVISERPMDVLMVEDSTSIVETAAGRKFLAVNPPQGTTRKADAFEELRGLVRNGTLVNVEGLARPLENYQIESVSAPREVVDAGILTVSIVLVEHRTAEIEEVSVPSPRVERGRGRSDSGIIGAGVSGSPGVTTTTGAGIGAGATVLDPAPGSNQASAEPVSNEPDERAGATSTLRNVLRGGPATA